MKAITGKRPIYEITFDQETVSCSIDSPILAAARSRFLKLPYGCFNGGCGMCKVQIIAGDYEIGLSSKAALSDYEREKGYALACKTYPLSDLMVRTMEG
ncbi:2Fe-2S iron-sulfur cluster binding domain-containing protein [Aneurinibacillus aneurinilyticus]|jgi:CDP-4-dehydro-6-deoxyglucose reductase|uniref:2Fe-2S iron-sulfur cluster binding domain-containing protein n=1 Tax=Aneurinibacillus aneurinilyticus TaxID=1391 RepID=A0A848CTY0_ANEAE|nr:2Fe-2S iron-sulfur cluster binding domain-containing protein [Aneurinibacillus aneurinilyticus]MCI1696526.1 2Fe-2S iron-sulfur cluster binding domain-containing protein [Aneurinibacillus aneurinilyticus]MED0671676.1 2Fe-2S iron-sulfur cluster binding domain-containing protein [Aneurinibacillus aneurinilyticus]NME97819.1 2Fe-2S iron-sulfur cluster binding domain-containing protein [Aneurinibacillus aneurinilyticus]